MLHWLLPLLASPLVEASDFTTPGLPMYLGIAALVIGFLVLRFIIKTAITLTKVGILVAIGVATYLGLTFIVDAIQG